MFHVTILMNTKGTPVGQLAEAELVFTDAAGPLAGLKLIGFSVWERRGAAAGSYNVTFPARQYSINGERRSFALLRPTSAFAKTDGVRDAIVAAYELMLSTQV